jgi:UDP-N-acetylglucosamine acyltransferase
MPRIHPTAIVAPQAELADDAVVGPYCVVGEHVHLAAGVDLHAHVVVDGYTTIGERTRIFPFASIGLEPQDLKYQGEPSRLSIGNENTIREHVTINPGTTGGGMVTRIGDHCLLMVGVHIAHDCQVGNHVIMANNSVLAGHIAIDDYAFFGGLCAVHQFVRIGKHAMIGGMTGVENDVIPYATVTGNRAHLSGLNLVGLKRRGFSREDIHALRNAYRLLFAPEGTMIERLEEVVAQFQNVAPVMEIVDFIRADSSRAMCQPKLDNAA